MDVENKGLSLKHPLSKKITDSLPRESALGREKLGALMSETDMISKDGPMRGEGGKICREVDEPRSIGNHTNHTLSLGRMVRHRSTDPQSETTPPNPAGSVRWVATPPAWSAALRGNLLRTDPTEMGECLSRELRLPQVGCLHLSPSPVSVAKMKWNSETGHLGESRLSQPASEQRDAGSEGGPRSYGNSEGILVALAAVERSQRSLPGSLSGSRTLSYVFKTRRWNGGKPVLGDAITAPTPTFGRADSVDRLHVVQRREPRCKSAPDSGPSYSVCCSVVFLRLAA
jgi:hypothetical protein